MKAKTTEARIPADLEPAAIVEDLEPAAAVVVEVEPWSDFRGRCLELGASPELAEHLRHAGLAPEQCADAIRKYAAGRYVSPGGCVFNKPATEGGPSI